MPSAKEPDIVPLPGKTNVALVSEQLGSLIREGAWGPDEKLPSESELGRKFNVGRSTVREALNVLKTRELVYTVPGLGTFVNKRTVLDAVMLSLHIPDPASEKDLLNIMELRLALEPLCAALAARRAGAAQVREMERLQKRLLACDDPRAFAELDIAFHMFLAESTGNPLFRNAMNLVRSFLQEQQILTSREEWRRNKAGKFHAQVIDSIRNHDEFAAEDVMREHMDDTYIYIKSIIDKSHNNSGRWRRRRERGDAGRAVPAE